MAFWDGAAGGIAAGVGTAISSIGSNKRFKKQLALQEQINDRARAENFKYGEMAADSAYERSLGLLDAQTEANSYGAKLKDIQENNLSYSLLAGGAGGGGSAGGGAMGGGAKGMDGEDVAALKQIQNQRKALAIEGLKATSEAAVNYAERDKIKAEAENTREDTENKRTLTPLEAKKIEQDIAESVQRQGRFDERTSAEIAKIVAETSESEANREAAEALAKLNDEKTKGYWIELLNAIRETDIKERSLENDRINALANQLSARAAYINAMTGERNADVNEKNAETNRRKEMNPGGLTNVKTWKSFFEGVIEETKEPDNIIGNIIRGSTIEIRRMWPKYKK